MRVLVTGGAGYIGSVVVEELIKDDHEVIVYDNLSKGHRSSVHRNAHFINDDLLQKEFLTGILRESRTEAVVHMAAYSLVGESVAHRESTIATISWVVCR
jgi:UDP-glucose 4-epimerase